MKQNLIILLRYGDGYFKSVGLVKKKSLFIAFNLIAILNIKTVVLKFVFGGIWIGEITDYSK